MEITVLKHNDQFCGVYLDNGILLDARVGVGEAIKEAGVTPKTVLLTGMSGDPIAGLEELGTLPIGDMAHVLDCEIEQFPVGTKGNRQYGYSIKTPDGKLVYAPKFDRIEKSRLLGADLAVLDPGDRGETGEVSGLSHRAFIARERMTTNALVGLTCWTDNATGVYTLESSTSTNPVKVSATPVSKSIDLEAQIQTIRDAFNEYEFDLPVDQNNMYVMSTFDDYIIVCHYGMDYADRECFKITYTVSNGVYAFAQPAQWTKVVAEMVYTTAKSSLTIQKEQNGDRKWIAVSSSDFRDADNEKVSTQAMDFAIEIAKKRGSAGDLVWDHYDELPIGRCLKQTRVGRFLIEEGEFYNTAFAQKAADKLETSKPGEYRISIGFKYWQGTQSDDGTFYFIDIFHRATTTHPSNATTSVEVIKNMKTLTADARKAIAAELNVTEAEIDELVSKVVKEDKPAEEVKLKEEEKPATPATEPTDIEKALARITELETALKAKPDVAELVKSELKSLFRDAASGTVIRPTTTGAEITEDEKRKAADLVKPVEKASTFDAFYQRFTSSELNK